MIRQAEYSDLSTVAVLALQLWPDNTFDDLLEEFSTLLSDSSCAVFLFIANDTPVAFAQCQLRNDYVEGCDSSPVGYLEGIFVSPEYRKQGVARMLLNKCETWAHDHGCTEFASDCELDNDSSLLFHLKAGFIESNRIICFSKKI